MHGRRLTKYNPGMEDGEEISRSLRKLPRQTKCRERMGFLLINFTGYNVVGVPKPLQLLEVVLEVLQGLLQLGVIEGRLFAPVVPGQDTGGDDSVQGFQV